MTDEQVRELAAWAPHPSMDPVSPFLPHYAEKAALAREVLSLRALAREMLADLGAAECEWHYEFGGGAPFAPSATLSRQRERFVAVTGQDWQG